jgi:hypothetical protein
VQISGPSPARIALFRRAAGPMGDIEVSGRRRAGAHRWRRMFACAHHILDSLPLPTGVRMSSQENPARVRSQPSLQATDFVRMHLRTAVKGLSVRSCSAPPRRKMDEGRRDPAPSRARKRNRAKAAITCEDTRVRECDLIMWRVASSPHRQSNRRRAKDEDTSDRGSCVRFTSCVVSRSRLLETVRIYHQRARFRRATGVSEVA